MEAVKSAIFPNHPSVGHVSTALSKTPEDKPDKPAAAPFLDITGNFTAMAAAVR